MASITPASSSPGPPEVRLPACAGPLRSRRRRWRGVFLVVVLLGASVASAAGFRVLSADTRLEQEVYRLDARVAYQFSQAAMDALHSGVPLTIELQMEVLQRRSWVWDLSVAALRQLYRLEYHALARQYLVVNLNSGEFRSFPTRSAATEFLGRVRDFPLLDHSLLQPGESYYARIRARLDIEALPAPLRPVAYLSPEWRLASEWYSWPL